MNIPIEISARHVHLTQSDWEVLFGQAAMTPARDISQAPQFVAAERLKLLGPKGEIPEVGIVGPFRTYTQVELAMTDARRLGLNPPLTDSGNLNQAVEITLVGPVGHLSAPAAIIQQRHLHVSIDEARLLNIKDSQDVSVVIDAPRGGRLDHVLVRVDPNFNLRLHLDTDEANALGVTDQSYATLA